MKREKSKQLYLFRFAKPKQEVRKIRPGIIYQKDGIDFEGRILTKIEEIIEDTEDDLPF